MGSVEPKKPEAISRCDAILRFWWYVIVASTLIMLGVWLIGGIDRISVYVLMLIIALQFVGTPLERWRARKLNDARDLDWYACPRCLYDLRGSTGDRCPECGRTCTKESAKQEWCAFIGGRLIDTVGRS